MIREQSASPRPLAGVFYLVLSYVDVGSCSNAKMDPLLVTKKTEIDNSSICARVNRSSNSSTINRR